MSKAPRSNFGMALRAESQRPATSLQSRSRRTESAQNPAAGGISTRASQKGAPPHSLSRYPTNSPRVGSAASTLGETPPPCEVCPCFSRPRSGGRPEARSAIPRVTPATGRRRRRRLPTENHPPTWQVGGGTRPQAPPSRPHWRRPPRGRGQRTRV